MLISTCTNTFLNKKRDQLILFNALNMDIEWPIAFFIENISKV